MIKLRKEKQYVEVNVVDSLICDICGKEIPIGESFYACSTNHTDWGNDSVDTLEEFDVCSDDCLTELFVDYIALKKRFIHTCSPESGQFHAERTYRRK